MENTRQTEPTNFIEEIITRIWRPISMGAGAHAFSTGAQRLSPSAMPKPPVMGWPRNTGAFNLRFDDTNPTKEDVEYVESIKEDLAWLGAMG